MKKLLKWKIYLIYIPDQYKRQDMCERNAERVQWAFCVFGNYKARVLCNDAVCGDSYSLKFVLDWFATQELVETAHDEEDYCSYNDPVEWRNDCK